MQTKKLHSWNLSYSEARELQVQLACKVECTPLKKMPKLIAGLDCALSRDSQRIIASAVVLRPPNAGKGLCGPLSTSTCLLPEARRGDDFEFVETATASQEVSFPYIPGLLSFREAPGCIAAVEKLESQPDIFIIDGQGIAHPRRLGLASHLGLFFDKPTIGCAKSRLTGYFEDPPLEKGSYSLLKDNKGPTAEIIGAVVRTRTNIKPVFVSVGNKCLLQDAIKITLAYTTKYRLPEPTRLAHQLVSKKCET